MDSDKDQIIFRAQWEVSTASRTVNYEGVYDGKAHRATYNYRVKTDSAEAEGQIVLTITPRPVTLTSPTAEKEYDGTPLRAETVEVTAGSFAAGEGVASYNVTGSQLYVGTSPNHFGYVLKQNTLPSNYNITKIEGQLTITARNAKYELEVAAPNKTVTYDGQTHRVTELETTAFTVNGETYTLSGLTVSGEGTDAGEYEVKIHGTAVVEDARGNDVTKQFTVKQVEGRLTITKRTLVLISATAGKEYDGKALKNDGITVQGDDFARGEGASYKVSGLTAFAARTDVGEYTINVSGTAIVTDKEGQGCIRLVYGKCGKRNPDH